MIGFSLTDGQKTELLKIADEIEAACQDGSLSGNERQQLLDTMADCGLELPQPPAEPVVGEAKLQAELLDKVLEDMGNEELNVQLKAIMEEKQAILGRLGALQQNEEQRAGQEARLRELAEWLKQQKSEFAEYDDSITRRYVERITVVDAETIRIKFRYTDVEIDRAVRT